jgi:hypothetical protein
MFFVHMLELAQVKGSTQVAWRECIERSLFHRGSEIMMLSYLRFIGTANFADT